MTGSIELLAYLRDLVKNTTNYKVANAEPNNSLKVRL
jgi:hypothetical protein